MTKFNFQFPTTFESCDPSPICNISYINSSIIRHTRLETLFLNLLWKTHPLYEDGFCNDHDSITMYYDEENACFYSDENKSMRMLFIYKSRLTSSRDKFFDYLTEKMREINKDIISYENGIVFPFPTNEEATIINDKMKKIIELNLISFLGDKKKIIKCYSNRTISCIYNDNGLDTHCEIYILM